MAVDPHARPGRLPVLLQGAGVGTEVGVGVLGVDAALDGVAPQGDLFLPEGDTLVGGDA